MDDTSIRLAQAALRAGRYLEAASFLDGFQTRDSSCALLAFEVDYYLGRRDRVRATGAKLLEAKLGPHDLARCSIILGSQFCDEGETDEGVAFYRRALEIGQQGGGADVVCTAATKLLERSCDDQPFHASLPFVTIARRAATKAGDPQLTAQLHLSCGRLEGRAGHFETALRHFARVRDLLCETPNLRLASIVEHDEACVLGTLGDMEAALELIDQAVRFAEESGYAKGVALALGNRGHILASLGRYAEAERQLSACERCTFDNAAFAIARALTRAEIALRSGRGDVAQAIVRDLESNDAKVALWYRLEIQSLKARLLLRQGLWREALDCAQSTLTAASAAGRTTLAVALGITAAEAGILGDRQFEPTSIDIARDTASWPASLHGSYRFLLSKLLGAEGMHDRAEALAKQAERVIHAAGEVAAASEVHASANAGTVEGSSHSVSRALGLDVAATILDLAAFPHIWAREVLTTLEIAGCSAPLALIAAGASGPRVIEARGVESLDGIRERPGEKVETITIGEHRGEIWKIVARPKATVDDRCTFIAVQKIADAAAELGHLRRQEHRRSALWPADAFETDATGIWASEPMAEVMTIARRIAPTTLPMLLTGETGTGKEVLAQTIHRASDRADKTFLPFNCSAVPRDMIESQLFGYKKGAFTGADSSFQGVIRSAAGGTLFLDEIADIGLELQPKLLRFLETNEIHPLGEPQPVKVDVRVIAATNANLDQLVAEGRFREDLFYRLNVVRLKLPPLRERREEIPALVQHYVRKFADEQRKGHLSVSDETLEYLLLYSWPGNVRQLANEVRRMVAMAEIDSTLTPAQLSPEIQATRRTIPADAVMPATEPELRIRLNQPLPDAVEMLEQSLIRHALQKSGGRVEEAARILGISRKGLFLKRRRWNLDQRQAS